MRKKEKYQKMKPENASRLSTTFGGTGTSLGYLKTGKVSPYGNSV